MSYSYRFLGAIAGSALVFLVCAWFQPHSAQAQTGTLSSKTGHAPLIQVYNGKLYMVFVSDDDDENIMFKRYNGRTWERAERLSDKTSLTPTLAEYKGLLYMAYKSQSGERIYTKVFDGKSWGPTQRNASLTKASPTLIEYKGLLCMFFNEKVHAGIWYKTFDGKKWSSPRSTGRSTWGQPSVAEYDGALYLAHRYIGDLDDIHGEKEINILRFDGARWTSLISLPSTTQDVPTLATYGGYLYLFFTSADEARRIRGDEKNDLLGRVFDGLDWHDTRATGSESPNSPTAVEFDGKLLMAFKRDDHTSRVQVREICFDDAKLDFDYYCGPPGETDPSDPCDVHPSERVDGGYAGISRTRCEARRMCWDPTIASNPDCYRPTNYQAPAPISPPRGGRPCSGCAIP